jgi:hypothetical protein
MIVRHASQIPGLPVDVNTVSFFELQHLEAPSIPCPSSVVEVVCESFAIITACLCRISSSLALVSIGSLTCCSSCCISSVLPSNTLSLCSLKYDRIPSTSAE